MRRFDAKFLVMRRATFMGLPARVSVAHRAYTLPSALAFAATAKRRASAQVPVAFWIERIGHSARRPARVYDYGHR